MKDVLKALAILFAILVAAYSLVPPAHGQDHQAGHLENHDVYKTWRMPHAPHVSCCERKDVDAEGKPKGDCYPTEFRPVLDKTGRFDHWMARRDNGAWLDIPDNRLIRETNPDPSGVSGHLCEWEGTVYCARPPTGSL